jgi:hypothetical protein
MRDTPELFPHYVDMTQLNFGFHNEAGSHISELFIR